jgi:hypothetical protein
MRVYGPNGVVAGAVARETRRAEGPAFALPGASAPERAPAVRNMRPIGSVDALIAVQAVEGREERRRRAVKRGRVTLDLLDRLKIALLGGPVDRSLVEGLRTQAGSGGQRSGEPGLDAVMDEIDLRLAVELAKFDGKSKTTDGQGK